MLFLVVVPSPVGALNTFFFITKVMIIPSLVISRCDFFIHFIEKWKRDAFKELKPGVGLRRAQLFDEYLQIRLDPRLFETHYHSEASVSLYLNLNNTKTAKLLKFTSTSPTHEKNQFSVFFYYLNNISICKIFKYLILCALKKFLFCVCLLVYIKNAVWH